MMIRRQNFALRQDAKWPGLDPGVGVDENRSSGLGHRDRFGPIIGANRPEASGGSGEDPGDGRGRRVSRAGTGGQRMDTGHQGILHGNGDLRRLEQGRVAALRLQQLPVGHGAGADISMPASETQKKMKQWCWPRGRPRHGWQRRTMTSSESGTAQACTCWRSQRPADMATWSFPAFGSGGELVWLFEPPRSDMCRPPGLRTRQWCS